MFNFKFTGVYSILMTSIYLVNFKFEQSPRTHITTGVTLMIVAGRVPIKNLRNV